MTDSSSSNTQEAPTSPTRLFLSTTLPAANAMYGKKGPFEGIRHATTIGRFTAWSGDNLYAASAQNTYLTGQSGIKIVAGASVSPDSETSAQDDTDAVKSHSPHASSVPLITVGDGGAGFSALTLLGLAQTLVGTIAYPPDFLYSPLLKGAKTWNGVPLALLSPVGLGAAYFLFVQPPFSLLESANLETHAKANAVHTAKGNIENKALGKFSGTGLLGASLASPFLTSVTGGVSASVTGMLSAGLRSIKGGTEVSSRWGETKIMSFNGHVSMRGTEVNIGMDEDTPAINLEDIPGMGPRVMTMAGFAAKSKVAKATHNVHVRAQDGISLKAANVDLHAKPDEDPGQIRLTTSMLMCSADEYALVNSGSGTLSVTDESATLIVARAPVAPQVMLESQRETLTGLRKAARKLAEKARESAMASAVASLARDPLGGIPIPADELAEAEAEVEASYRGSLTALEEAFAEASQEPDILLNSGIQIQPDKVVIHAGPTAVTVDVESGEVRIEQTAGPSPVVASSVVLSEGAIKLQAQTTVSIEAGGQTFSFGPTGYSGPAMTELP